MVLFGKDKSSVQTTTATTTPTNSKDTSKGKGKNSNSRRPQPSSSASLPAIKRGKDTPVRKSDRRHLLQNALQVFQLSSSVVNEDIHVTENDEKEAESSSSLQQQEQPPPHSTEASVAATWATQLHYIFLKGSLLQRTLVQPVTEKRIRIYYRGPNDDESTDKDDSVWFWPYHQLTQAIWLEVQESGSQYLPLPTVALMSALSLLPLQSVLTTTTTTETTTTTKTPLFADLLPTIVIFPHVSKYLCRGADLMKAGIAQIHLPNNWSLDDKDKDLLQSSFSSWLCLIQVQGNPQPFAVGCLESDCQEWISSDSLYGPGTQGVAVNIYTCYGDDLWRQQLPPPTTTTTKPTTPNDTVLSLFDQGHYGNPGFVQGQHVVPVVAAVQTDEASQQQQETDHPNTSSLTDTPPVSNEDAIVEDDTSEDKNNLAEVATAASTPIEASSTAAAGTTTDSQGQEQDQQVNDQTSLSEATLSPEEVLHQATCRALVQLHLKRDLPMAMSVFYSQHVLKQQQPSSKIQLKQTRYKKFGVYVQEQIDRELIQVGLDAGKKDPMAMLVAYDPRHDDLIPYQQEKKAQQQESNEQQQQQQSTVDRLVLVDLYRIPQNWVALLRLNDADVQAQNASSDERRGTGFLTSKEVKAILEQYLERESLVDRRNPGQVLLDGPLTDALYHKNKKANKQKQQQTGSSADEPPPPMQLSRKDLSAAWLDKMETAYALVAMPGNRVKKLGRGKPPLLTIEVVRRQTKKYCTKLYGTAAMDIYGVHVPTLRQELMHRFACAVTVEEVGHVELQLQGNWVDEVEALLVGDASLTSHGGAKDSPYNVPPTAIQVLLRKGVPARKQRGAANKKKNTK